MPAAASPPKVSPARIMQDLETLPFATLNKLMPKIVALRLKKHPQVMSAREERLQKRIEAGVPKVLWAGYVHLTEKRRVKGLNSREQARIEELVDKMETFNVEWLKWAMELAEIRRVPVQQLLKSLNITRPDNV